MSRVFLAEEVALGRRVVLKVLAPDLAHVLSAERFEREIRVAARLQHPQIVPRQLTPDGLQMGSTAWAVSPDGAMLAVSSGKHVELFRVAGGDARRVPGWVWVSMCIGRREPLSVP